MIEPIEALTRRVLDLEARESITFLSTTYCVGADHRDLELFLSVWSEDGVWEPREGLLLTGRAEIAEGIELQWTFTARSYHWTANPLITISPDGAAAEARFDVLAETEMLDGSWVRSAGTYRDSYARFGDRWLLSRRAADVHSQRPL